jgi:hypothetical protein
MDGTPGCPCARQQPPKTRLVSNWIEQIGDPTAADGIPFRAIGELG